ncbi:hypothetical protein N665_0124s0051 [Sinapis alba]|nr:hypothetical protein N665_0124s0051 [Sinapis alba]
MSKIIMIVFAIMSVAGTGRITAQQNTSSMPTYSLWCVANPYVSFSRVHLERRWACANGANCSAIETGGHCHDLYYGRRGASFAFNDYYQKNPIPNNCVFNGAAILNIQDPSSPTCKFPSNR